MLDLYAFATPNSIKVPILLEELRADYTYHPVNIRQGEQKTTEFLALNPNGKVPVIVDLDGPGGAPITITESAAILIYLAQKFGRFMPESEIGQVRMFEWLFFPAAGLGPAFGQAGYFQKLAPEPIPAAIERFHGEAKRTLKVLDGRLARVEYLAGDYSIADTGKLRQRVADLLGYLERNKAALVHYAARRRGGEPIATSFVESAVDEIIAWRMTKAPQMRWSRATVPAFLDVRTAVLNDTLENAFRRRHPGFGPANDDHRLTAMAA